MMRPLFQERYFQSAALALSIVFWASAAPAQTTTTIHIDASAPWQPPVPARYDEASARSPSGQSITLNSRSLMLDGKPWLPVTGEFHFSRYPRAQWEEEILKMKASGVNIVSTYVIWIHHEEIRGQFDWAGQRDLRAFAQLCAKHGLYMVARIGPWAHGEVRNGGFPDWVVRQGPTRENDPVYLASVRAWYGQIGQQLQGLLWKGGGPVIGIQLENEYSKRGPGAGAAHILELKRLAMNSGLDAPLWLVTGWDDAVVPPRAVLPVYGGYADAPWDRSLAKQPPSEVYAFRFGNRISGNMDAIADATAAIRSSQADDLPFLTAEIGGGIEDTYHRRPVILPDDTAAMFPVMLGSGVNLYGTYMFQGGENPEGKHTPLEESHATGYPNDLPVRSYDFQAPLGEFGQERASFRKLKVFQYFLNGFGDVLAPMAVHAPDKVPENPSDFTVLRASVRSRGNSGFIFVNNHVRGYSLPARPQTQFEIAVPGGILHVPRRPMDIPSGAYFIWPFNLQVGGITLRYSTAELFTLLEDHGETTLVFDAIPGIEPEFALDAATAQVIGAATGELQTDGGVTYISAIQPGEHASIELRSREGKTLRLLVLSSQQAEDAWKIHAADGDHLLITTQDFFSDQKGGLEQVYLHSRGSAQFAFSILPSLPQPITSTLPLHEHSEGMFSAQAPPRDEDPQVAPVREADDPPPVRIGPGPHGVPEVPTEDAFRQAAGWSITVPAHALDGLSNLFLEIGYEGDIARLSRGDKLLVDNFYNGEPWTVGLKRFLDPALANRFMLQVLPLRADSPVYFDAGKRPAIPAGGRIDQLQGIRLTPEYQLTLTVR